MAVSKLIEGSVYIEDRASKTLSSTERELKKLTDKANTALKSVSRLNSELSRSKKVQGSLADRKAQTRTFKISDFDVSKTKQLYRRNLPRVSSTVAMPAIDLTDKSYRNYRTEFQKRMLERAGRGGLLSPMWENLSKYKSSESVMRNPSAITEGLMSSISGLGRGGRGVAGAIAGRVIGGAFGSATLGSLIGGGAMGGPIGVAIAAGMSAIIEIVKSGVQKVVDYVSRAMEIFTRTATERATESTSLRRKMQMSNEMFGIANPRDIKAIDKDVYSYREYERQAYTRGLSGRDISTSAIEWLHLLGTKDNGGTFKNRQEAFDFSEALSAIAKMNGLSDSEYETVRYQGMQIMSKGYADILDIKPLLNSAPGFIRDLLQQTGMSRKELLESGRSRSFTSDKFIEALLNVRDYYTTLSDRATSRTAEQQQEAADAIIGQASVWYELEKKATAESNLRVMAATAMSGIMEDMSKTWYQMWSDGNDARDGINKKVEFEKEIVYRIMQSVIEIYATVRMIKNVFDIIYDVIVGTTELIIGSLDVLTNGLKDAMGMMVGSLASWIGDLFHSDTMRDFGEKTNPFSATNKNEQFKTTYAEKMAEAFQKDVELYGAEAAKEGWKSVFEGSQSYAIPGTGFTKSADEFYTALFDNERIGKVIDKSKLAEAFRANSEMYLREGDNGLEFRNDKYIGTTSPEGVSTSRALSDIIGATGKSASDFGFMDKYYGDNSLIGKGIKKFGEIGDEVNDINDTMAVRDRLTEELRKQYENTKNPYIEKVAKDTEQIAGNTKGSAKVNTKILDVLRLVAGTTVINKVTTVRPDYYQTFGNISGGDVRNAARMGVNVGELTAALNNRLPRGSNDGHQPSFEQQINGATTAYVN